MACFHPIPARRDGTKVVLHPKPAITANLYLPCGNCVGCKVARAQEWASRCMHELREHHSAVFATLTYDDESCPRDGSLVPRDLALFLKRLRKISESPLVDWLNLNTDGPYVGRLRYVACGEYGEKFGRPHYHVLLFGASFNDAVISKHGENPLWCSPGLAKVWGKGKVDFGTVTKASAAYVAGYIHKSMGRNYCDSDGVVIHPPFLRCSQGIGKLYAKKFADDFRSGVMVVEGDKRKIPRYYKKVLESRPDILASIEARSKKFVLDPKNHSKARRVAGEVIAKRKRELSHRPTL